ncbi:MAG: VanZ family protein [Bacillota bacterium]|nr:VanZ family protein [Bacillota bacterium]
MKDRELTAPNKKNGIIAYLLLILWVLLLFHFSNQPFQQQDVEPLLQRVIAEEQLMALLPKVEFHYGNSFVTYTKPYRFTQFFIRKGAHLFVYGILGYLLVQVATLLILKKTKAILAALYIAGVVAYFDEYNQGLSPNRTGSVYDVGLDLIGASLGISLFWVVIWLANMRKSKELAK